MRKNKQDLCNSLEILSRHKHNYLYAEEEVEHDYEMSDNYSINDIPFVGSFAIFKDEHVIFEYDYDTGYDFPNIKFITPEEMYEIMLWVDEVKDDCFRVDSLIKGAEDTPWNT